MIHFVLKKNQPWQDVAALATSFFDGRLLDVIQALKDLHAAYPDAKQEAGALDCFVRIADGSLTTSKERQEIIASFLPQLSTLAILRAAEAFEMLPGTRHDVVMRNDQLLVFVKDILKLERKGYHYISNEVRKFLDLRLIDQELETKARHVLVNGMAIALQETRDERDKARDALKTLEAERPIAKLKNGARATPRRQP